MTPMRNSISFHQPCGQKAGLGRASRGNVSRVAAVFKRVSLEAALMTVHVREARLSVGFRWVSGKTLVSRSISRQRICEARSAPTVRSTIATASLSPPRRWRSSMNGLAIRTFVCGLAVGIGLLAATPMACAGETIRIMVAGIEKQIYLPGALADALGYFTAQGLTVQLLSEASGVHAEDQLLTGAVQAVVGFYDHTINLQAKGKFVQAVVQFSQAPGEAVLVGSRLADTIRSPADFKGRTLGVTGLGSSTQLLTQYLAVDHGLKPADMRFVAVGAGDS